MMSATSTPVVPVPSPQAPTMDDVVALSASLRASQRMPITPSAAIDDIPFLTRALSQIHYDSTRLLTMRTASALPTPTVQASALRLFASLDFQVDRLRRAVTSLPDASNFVDKPARPVPPFRHPFWLAPRAVNDARLILHAALRDASESALRLDLDSATHSFIDTISNLYPPNPLPSSTPSTNPSKSIVSNLNYGQSPHRSNANSTPITEQLAPPIAAAPLPEPYVNAIAEVATNNQSSSIATLFHEAAVVAEDAPHFVHTLDILTHTAKHAPVAQIPAHDLAVWAARAVLENQFAMRIPGLPDNVRTASPQAIIPHVERYVSMVFTPRNSTRSGHAQRNNMNGSQAIRPSIWSCVFYCLRIGAVAAATHLLQRTSSLPAQFFTWFLQGRDVVHASFKNIYPDAGYALDGNVGVAGCLTEQHMYDEVATEYRCAALSSDDAYMRACYVLLMRLELSSPASVAETDDVHHTGHGLSRRSTTAGGRHELYSLFLSDGDFEEVLPSVEDYLWLKLWLSRTRCESDVMAVLPNSSFLTLATIQTEITACGEAHFDPDGTQPLLYAFILVATMQYEKAVMYLYEHGREHWLHYSLHLALVLYHLQWLQSADSWFERMMRRYVEQVARRNVTDAVLYTLTVRGKEFVTEVLRNVARDSGEYELVFGREDGSDGGGCVAAIMSTNLRVTPSGFDLTDLRALREEVAALGAQEASVRREFGRAADLYQLAGRESDVIDMRMRDMADEVHKLWSGRRSSVLKSTRQALRTSQEGRVQKAHGFARWLILLLAMSDVFEDYWTGRYAAAWSRLRGVEVLPLCGRDISACQNGVRECSRAWNGGYDHVAECVVELLKVVLHIAEYGLESGSVRLGDLGDNNDDMLQEGRLLRAAAAAAAAAAASNISGGAGVGGSANAARDVSSVLPHVSEIKSVCAFAALLKCGDDTVDQRLVKIESLVVG